MCLHPGSGRTPGLTAASAEGHGSALWGLGAAGDILKGRKAFRKVLGDKKHCLPLSYTVVPSLASSCVLNNLAKNNKTTLCLSAK